MWCLSFSSSPLFPRLLKMVCVFCLVSVARRFFTWVSRKPTAEPSSFILAWDRRRCKTCGCIRKIGKDMEKHCVATKVRVLYESIVLSTLLYRAETWPITVANRRSLDIVHHR